jgi:hypothetical protein
MACGKTRTTMGNQLELSDTLLASGAILIALSVIILLSAATIAKWRSKRES